MVEIIAELCQNHNGDPHLLKEMLWSAAENGADYAKMQIIFSEDLTFREGFEDGLVEDNMIKTIKRPYSSEYERLKKLDLEISTYEMFIDECISAGIKPMATIFTRDKIEIAKTIGFKEIKVASYDCASHKFISELKDNFDRLIISTGATFLNEIQKTTDILKNYNFSLLHCVTLYPTPLEQLNLRKINFLKKYCNATGFSDHTDLQKNNLTSCIIALWLGADIIERHFTVLEPDKTKDGIVSLNPEKLKSLVELSQMNKDELFELVQKIDNYEKILGVENPSLTHEELLNRDYYRGRFASKIDGKIIYNWDDKEMNS